MSILHRDGQDHYGTCGVKVWVFKGEVLAHDPMAQDKRAQDQQAGGRSEGRTDGRS
jgi:small subunit ribosomal protein S3